MILDLQLGRADRIIWSDLVNRSYFGLKAVVLMTPILVFGTSADSTKKAPDVKVLLYAWMLKSLCCQVTCHLTVFLR